MSATEPIEPYERHYFDRMEEELDDNVPKVPTRPLMIRDVRLVKSLLRQIAAEKKAAIKHGESVDCRLNIVIRSEIEIGGNSIQSVVLEDRHIDEIRTMIQSLASPYGFMVNEIEFSNFGGSNFEYSRNRLKYHAWTATANIS